MRTKTSQEEQETLYPLLDHAAARLVKIGLVKGPRIGIENHSAAVFWEFVK